MEPRDNRIGLGAVRLSVLGTACSFYYTVVCEMRSNGTRFAEGLVTTQAFLISKPYGPPPDEQLAHGLTDASVKNVAIFLQTLTFRLCGTRTNAT